MKKCLSQCSECGDNSAILIQVNSDLEVISLSTDCDNLEYLKEIQIQIRNAKNR